MPLLESRMGAIWNLAVQAADQDRELSNITLDEVERALRIFGNRVDMKSAAYAVLTKYRDKLLEKKSEKPEQT